MTPTTIVLTVIIIWLVYRIHRLTRKVLPVDLYLYSQLPTWNPGPLPSTQEIIKQLTNHRSVHVSWVEYLKQHPDTDATMVGDIAHHQRVSDIYSDMIKSLKEKA